MFAFTSGGTDFFNTAAVGESFVRNYYDAAERLRVSQRSYFFTDPGSNPRYRAALQEYFYDALGRRVAMRSRRDSTCTDTGDPTPGWDCAQTMERFVWDGDQLLAELRDYGWWGEDPATLNGNGSSTGNFYGTTTYTYALGLFGPDVPLIVFPASGGAVVPEASWRGTIEAGTNEDGTNATGYNWPGQQTGLYLAPDLRNTTRIYANKWYGSLVEGKVDPSGLVYDRNRYYDPTAGRFTQEDPIGLAGGLNLYGYANGDPVNSRDPFGLCPEGVKADSSSQTGNRETTLYCADGSTEVRQGGTPAWRNYNPGNLQASSLSRGTTGGFAVFSNETEGNEAMWRQFMLDAARGLTLESMIEKYSPPFQNNTAAYIAFVSQRSGVTPSAKLSSRTEVTAAAVIRAMQLHEGWKPGTVIVH